MNWNLYFSKITNLLIIWENTIQNSHKDARLTQIQWIDMFAIQNSYDLECLSYLSQIYTQIISEIDHLINI